MNDDRIYYSHEAEVRAKRATAELVLFCLLLGMGIGAAIVAFVSHSSPQLRANVIKPVEESLQQSRETVNPALKRLQEEFSDLRANVREHVPHLK